MATFRSPPNKRPNIMNFTRNTIPPKNNTGYINRNMRKMFSVASYPITTSGSGTSLCAANRRRNDCRYCNKIKTSPVTNIVSDVGHSSEVDNIVSDIGPTPKDCLLLACIGKNAYGNDASGCKLISNPDVCCTDGGDGSGCRNAKLICGLTPDVSLCGRLIPDCSGGLSPTGLGWEDAYFISGGLSGEYTFADLHLDPNIIANKPNGADSSCSVNNKTISPGDYATISACITGASNSTECIGKTAKECYNIKHTGYPSSGYYLSASSEKLCPADGIICLINPENGGKVAALEHGSFGTPLTGTLCTTKRWDKSLELVCPNVPYTNNCPAFDDITRKLHAIIEQCDDNPYTFIRDNSNNTQSCLIKKKIILHHFGEYFFDNPITTDGAPTDASAGVAIGWGHGVLDGGCGLFAFMQQGDGSGGLVKHHNPGHTTLSLQIGTRAWSGEWSDARNAANDKQPASEWGSQSAYLREGSNAPDALKNSQSCLQPRVKRADLGLVTELLDKICLDISGKCKITGCCGPGGNSKNSSCWGVGEGDCVAQDLSHGDWCKDPDSTWCCKWTPGTDKSGTCPLEPLPGTCTREGTSCSDISDCNSGPDDVCGSCNNSKCQKSVCIPAYDLCVGENPNSSQCCASGGDVYACRKTSELDDYRCRPPLPAGEVPL